MKKKLLLSGTLAIVAIIIIIFFSIYEKTKFKQKINLDTDVSFKTVRIIPTYEEVLKNLEKETN